jgi:hypothetical protein
VSVRVWGVALLQHPILSRLIALGMEHKKLKKLVKWGEGSFIFKKVRDIRRIDFVIELGLNNKKQLHSLDFCLPYLSLPTFL